MNFYNCKYYYSPDGKTADDTKMVYAYSDEIGYNGINKGDIVYTARFNESDLPVVKPPEMLKVITKLDGRSVDLDDPSTQEFLDMMPKVVSIKHDLNRNIISIDDIPDDNTPNDDTSTDDTPTDDTPNDDTSNGDDVSNGDDISNGDDTPNDDTSTDDTSTDDTSTDDTPNDDTPNGDTPNDDTPNGDTPNDDTPNDDGI